MKQIACVALVACAGHSSYLGAPLPKECATRDAEHCAGWMAEREIDAGELDLYEDAALQAYVQGIAERLARGTALHRAPHIVIADHDGTYAAFGDRIVIGRIAIEKLGSEAELAAIVAHELVHVEGHHATVSLFGPEADDEWLVARRDAEAVADERAVALLEHAGYPPTAMTRALSAELEADDDEHPTRDDRIAHVMTLAGQRNRGFEGRSELLAHINRMVVGRDTRLGIKVGDVWVVAALGLALEISPRDEVRVDGDEMSLRRGRNALTAYAIGLPWARELANKLEQRNTLDTPLGPVAVGLAPLHDRGPEKPLDRLERAVRALLPQPEPGAPVVIVARGRGGLVIEMSPHVDPRLRDYWLQGLRAAQDSELRAAEPTRIVVAIAPRTAPVRELITACPDPMHALELDDADRIVAAGSPFKCTDR